MSQPITLTLAQRAPRPLRWLGILLVLGLLSMPFLALLPASHPLAVPSWLLTLSGKILCYAIVAVALDLVWGYAGMLSLGHGISCPRRVRHGDVPDAPGGGRRSAGVYVFSLLERAALVLVGHAAFRLGDGAGGAGSRSAGPGFRLVCLSLEDQGVYFSIMTQALTYAGMLLFFRNETGFGGNNGFTGFTTLLGFPVTATGTRASLFMATVLLLLLTLWLGAALAQSKFGRILTAVRDAENRLMFCGYDPRGFKLLVWTLSAVLCGLAGALYVPQVGIINPSEMSPTNSIEAAIWVALGGRGTLIGPVLGAGLVNGAKSIFTVAMPEYWQLFLGLIFIIVTLFLPRGVMGLLRRGDR